MNIKKLMESGINFYSDPKFEEELAVYTYEENITFSLIKSYKTELI